MKKRILCLALVMVMIFTLLPMSAFAADVVSSGTCGSNLTWTLDSEGTLTISGTGAMTDYSNDSNAPWFNSRSSIKSVIIENGVTSIGGGAFFFCSSLTSVTIPDSVTTIGDYAFNNCENLTSVTIGRGVTSIGKSAFRNCSSLTSVTIPDSVTTIGESAFDYCSSLTSVTIPDSVTSIGDYAFYGCSSLTSVTIGRGVTSIGDYAFERCSSLTSINVDNNNEYYSSSGGVLFDKNQTILICYPAGKTESNYTIPGSVTTIVESAFEYCSSLTSVTIPDSVTSIGNYAFYDCTGLTSVTIGNSVTSIGDYAFIYCSSLTSINVDNNNEYYSSSGGVLFDKNQTILICYPAGKTESNYTIPDSVTTIGDYAFSDCSSLTNVAIPDSVTSIGESAFSGCSNLTSITIPDSVTTIGKSAFSDCYSLTSVTIGSGVTSIGDWAFTLCSSLTSVTIGSGVTSIGDYAFESCYSLTSVTIGSGVTTIGDHAFYNCISLTSVTIPDSVTSIGGFAFSKCSSLTSVTIGSGVTSIYKAAFNNCSSLTDVYYGGSEEQWNQISIDIQNENLTEANIHFKTDTPISNPFTDVSESSVYYDAILWAYYHEPEQITGGYTATEFRPGNPCTRGQAVTFLWRAAGCPEPTGDTSMFNDASSIAAPYQKAVAWAVEKGITTGYNDGTFRPNDSVTRAQFVTFLWRYEGKPATSGSIAGFTDASSISGPYQQAVSWAVEKGITTGYNDGSFRPNDTCTRWAVVLFMYRDME